MKYDLDFSIKKNGFLLYNNIIFSSYNVSEIKRYIKKTRSPVPIGIGHKGYQNSVNWPPQIKKDFDTISKHFTCFPMSIENTINVLRSLQLISLLNNVTRMLNMKN